MLKLDFKLFACSRILCFSLLCTPDLNFMCLNVCELLLLCITVENIMFTSVNFCFYALRLRILRTHVASGFTGKMTNVW